MDNKANGYAVYCLYHALKLHFTSSYDYFKYHGKVKLTKETFLNNKSKYYFYKLSRKYSLEELKEYFVATMVNKNIEDKLWIGDLVSEDSLTDYNEWCRIQQALGYIFQKDIQRILDMHKNPNDIFLIPNDNQWPPLLYELLRDSISKETVIIMNQILNFFPMWDKKIEDEFIWPKERDRLIKYAPFLKFDLVKMKAIMKKEYQNCLEDA